NFQSFLAPPTPPTPTLLPPADSELQRQLAFTTSSTKKRKLSPQHIPGPSSGDNPDIPLNSVEDCDSESPHDLPRFEIPNPSSSDTNLPPHIPQHLQNPSALSTGDCVTSAASSPTASYAKLSIEAERGGDSSAADTQRASLAPTEQDLIKSQSPLRSFSHRAIMGGAADAPQRSSSPLKRRASDLEGSDVPSTEKDDVDMISSPPSGPAAPSNSSESTATHQRAQSVDMLKDAGPEPANDPLVQTQNMEVEQEQSAAPPVADPQNDYATETPSIDIQIKTVTTLCEAAMQHIPQENDMMYIVSNRWLQRVLDRGSEARQKSKVEPEGEVGPIDNSDIIQDIVTDSDGKEFTRLKHGLGLESYALFPEEAWNLIISWYKLMPGAQPIQRIAHNTNPDKNGLPNTQYELHPPVFTIYRLYADNNPILVPQKLKVSNPPPLTYVLSASTRYYDFLKKIKEQSQIDLSKKVRVWRVPRLLPAAEPVAPTANTVTPPSSRPSSPAPNPTSQSREPQDSWKHLLLPVSTFLELEKGSRRELVNEERGDITLQKNYNGSSDLSMTSLGDSQHIVLDEAVDANNYVSNYTSKSGKSTAALSRTGMSQSQPNSGRNSPAPSGPMTRGRTQKSGKVPGTVGLSNLGNTCYMNSALQCVRSVEELTKYFLSGAATNELNFENPLGNHGQVAEAYARLLAEIYKEPVPTSVTPRNFKNVIGKYAPSFSGYGQQDSQEFLGFLLDGLQEDLSRVKKKPYIEKPDSTDEMVNNPEAIREMAAKVWDITKKRDDSVIADLFTGMYKSTLVCPVCSKVSITFDPFNNLTLQLPIENAWRHTILYFPLNERPHKIHVDMDKQGSILALKQFVSKRVDIPVERLFVAEEFKGKFYKIHDDNLVASEEIQNNDVCAIYELEAKPTNWPPVSKPKKKSVVLSYGQNDSDEEDVLGWQDPAAEKMLVPVFHRRPNPERAKWRKPWLLSDFPHFIVVTPEEARSEDVLKRKILEKVATFSSHSFFHRDDGVSDNLTDSIDPDIVLTTGSDADSSGDSKVVATSIDGEDGLVDVFMKEANGFPDPKENSVKSAKPVEKEKSLFPLKRFNNRRPKFLAPGSFLEPELQNLFTLGYFSTPNEPIPTGWNPVDEEKTYPTLSSRMPEPRDMRDGSSDSFGDGHTGSDSDEADSFQRRSSNGFAGQTRMNDESSEEDEIAAAPTVPRALPVRPAAPKYGARVGLKKRRPRNIKTYSKKGNQPRKFHELNAAFEQDTPDEGPLIRLGEGIVVDWDENAYSQIYDGDKREDDDRGCNLVRDMSTLEDPMLDTKRKTREQRRRNGITLDDCLNEFGKEEILSEADTWYCPRCKEHRRASKKFELWKTPDVLVMHLKRFSSSGWRRDKLDVMVDFPIEGLDLSSRVVETQEGKQEIYDLFAVDDHWGGLGGGHYTAFAKNYTDGEWYEYNDSSVTKTKDPSRVVTQSAYLLFYRRRSEVPLGGTKIQQIVQDFDNPPESGEDDITESGEEQGPVGSTFRGSSGPLTGVGATHRRPNPGSASTDRTTVNPSALEYLPAYEDHERNDEDAAPLLVSDAVMNDGLQESIEDEDEGVDMGDTGFNYTNIGPYDQLGSDLHSELPGGLGQAWNFGNLPGNSRGNQIISGTGSDMDDAASDVVQNNSSASAGSVQGRMEDFSSAVPDEDFVDQSPVPDIDEAAQLGAIDLHRDLLAHHAKNDFPADFDFRADETDEVEEPATEIHVEEGEGLEELTSKTMRF
ncbi:putative ubiquitin carboxyl-terminal hydrolase 12, partial [Lachnellula arida]